MRIRKKHTTQDETLGLHRRVCKTCGKPFECRTDYAYRQAEKKSGDTYFCSWGCMRKYEREKLAQSRQGKKPGDDAQKILRMLNRGLSMTEICDELGIRPSRVETIRDRWLYLEVKRDA